MNFRYAPSFSRLFSYGMAFILCGEEPILCGGRFILCGGKALPYGLGAPFALYTVKND
jgi:hypothetical protein